MCVCNVNPLYMKICDNLMSVLLEMEAIEIKISKIISTTY